MKVLFVTTDWPRFEGDNAGIHVRNQIAQLKNYNVHVDVFPIRGNKNPYAYWKASRAFRKMDLKSYDVIHGHHGQSGVVALAQKIRPVVMTFHGSDLQGIRAKNGRITFTGYLLRMVSRWVASKADAVILVAGHLAAQIPKRKYYLIPAGVDLGIFRPLSMADARVILNFPLNKRLILFVGNPDRSEKRFWLAEKTMADLPHKLNAQIVVANGIPPKDMPLYMNACDALLVTSSSEGSPNAVKEALACNLPVVSTNVGDIKERIQDIAGCEICDTDNASDLSDALMKVLSRSERINGRASVLDLDESLLAQKVISIYQSLLFK